MKNKYPKSEYKRLHNILGKMKQRCRNPKCSNYESYGGRGIFVCKEWDDTDTFIEWALSNGYRDDLTIDRINNDDGYYPENCRWTTYSVQSMNKRNSLPMVEYNGEKKYLLEWCNELGLSYDAMKDRIFKNGMSVEKAFETPLQTEIEHLAEICRERGVNYGTVRSRIMDFGWDLEKALSTPSKKAGKHEYPKIDDAICPICNKTFERFSKKARFCSRQCRKKAASIVYRRENQDKFELINGKIVYVG